ncbi:MAG: CotH kinase family protein [Prevotella sp.]|nr:CotH kinase family protein [Prevotella sp.]
MTVLLALILCTHALAQTISWVEPFMTEHEGTPPNATEVYFYHTGQGKFLTKGTTWGTHAALTSDHSAALVYQVKSLGTYCQLYSAGAASTGLMFVSNENGDPYTDYVTNSSTLTYTYFTLEELSNGHFAIKLAPENIWNESLEGYCLGWNPNNIDVTNNGTSLGTNIGIFALPAEGDNQTEWTYYTAEEIELYDIRVLMYNLYQQHASEGLATDAIAQVYNDQSSTLTQLNDAYIDLQVLIQNASGQETNIDMTSYIVNPTFSGNATGWDINMSGAQNKGYQSASYTNGNVSISQFAEAWIPSGSTLGAGSISQTITGLREGIYTLEADVIACNQATGETVTGVELFASSEILYSTSLNTENRLPQHFSMSLVSIGNELTIGIRTLEATTANWIAFDNVKLYYNGQAVSDATSISISPTSASLTCGEEITLQATVDTDNELYKHIGWSSSDEQIATVSSEGVVTALREGVAIITATASLSDLTATATITIKTSHPEQLVINEIQMANIDQFIDPSVNYGGWVEFYNPSSVPINLGGLYIEDNLGNSWQLPIDQGSVPAGGFKNIWFDHYDTGTEYSDEAYKQVNFKLNYEGGVISVANSDHTTILSQEYPAAIQRCSYARTTDGGDGWSWTSTPTPEATNVGSTFAGTQLPMPVIDKDGTLFTSGFTATVTIPDGATLRYTTDGSTPTLDNGQTSTTGVFDISNNTVLRLRLFQDGYLPSSVVTRSYIYADKNYYLPIVSVVTDEANLYDSTIGAYTDGTNGTSGNNRTSSNKNRSWERPVNFEYLTPATDGSGYQTALNQECDFEVFGGWSRHFAPNSSFSLKGSKQYLGQNFMPYPFFDEKPFIKNKGVRVRNGGNDNYGRIKDPAIHEILLTSGFHVDCQAVQPAHIFINGQYMFMFNLREANNKHHGYSNYGIDTDAMDQFECVYTAGYVQKTGNDAAFRQWMNLAQQLADSPTDESIYNSICDLVDIDEYCNYMAVECYSGCNDWATNSNNIKGYRSQQDGKFHLVFMDQDAGFNATNMLSTLQNYLYNSLYDTGKNFIIDIFLNMLKYEPFKKRFIDAFCLVAGSVYEPTRSTEIINSMKDHVYQALSFDGNAQNLQNSATNLINAITNSNNRSSRINNMRNYFSIGTDQAYTLNLSANIEEATLTLNNLEIPTAHFDGTLFSPAIITAKAPAGYTFKGWATDGTQSITDLTQIFGTSDAWNYYDQGSLDNQDWKSATYDDSAWSSGNAPLGYGNVGKSGTADYTTTLNYGTNSSQKRPTYYFRKTFTLDEIPSENDVYQLTYYVDDGFIAYLNGTEIGRYLMASGNATYSQYSSSYVGSTAATATITIDNSLLVKGENVLAIEVHNTSATSSDIYWTASLSNGKYSESSFVSTEESLDVTTLPDKSAALIATYKKLSDEELLADIATPIKVNEVSAGNTIFINDYFKKNDWIELYNTTDEDLNAAGLFLSDDVDDPLKYQIPANTAYNTIVPAHGHLIVWADKLEPISQLHADFKLSNSDGQMAVVTSTDEFKANNETFFNAHPVIADFADALFYDTHNGDQSVGRYPDGANNLYLMNRPTIKKANTLLSQDSFTRVDEGIMETGDATFTLNLDAGWNWISHPMADPLSVNFFKDFAEYIQGQTLEAYYSEENSAMKGLLKNLSVGHMYKIQMNEAHTYTFTSRLPVSAAPVALQPGWNWIGYPLGGSQTIDAAFAQSKLDEGDVVIGQSGFSTYSETDGWVGTLSTISAGYGYLYKTTSTKALHFTAPATRVQLRKFAKSAPKRAPVNGTKTSTTNLSLLRHQYPSVMAVIGQIMWNGNPVEPETFSLAAYADDELRGVSQVAGGKHFLTIYGDSGEELSFKAIDAEGNICNISETFRFNSDLKGTLQHPFEFTLQEGETNRIALPDSSTQQSTASTPVGYYTLSGIYAGSRPDSLRPGIYILRYQNGTHTKLLKK